MNRQIFIFLFLFFAPCAKSVENSSVDHFKNSFDRLGGFTNAFTSYLEDFNDRHLGQSEWGKILGYEELKPKITAIGHGRGIKKMSMEMMPLIFHVGATSTWMMLTSIMAFKSVAIGLLLLIFKIAVSSAKVASFFTLLKAKHAQHHHEYAWSPHGHGRSISQPHALMEIPAHEPWNSYSPEWGHSDSHSGYKTIPIHKENHIPSYDITYEESKHVDKKNGS